MTKNSQQTLRFNDESKRSSVHLSGLDWLRACASFLVVLAHSGIAYMSFRMPGLVWPTFDPVGSLTIDGLIWWIKGIAMPLFFLLSGFFSCQVMNAKGSHEFLKQRLRRLLSPCAFGLVFVLPFDLYALLLGWAGDGKITLHKLRSLKIDSPLADGLWGPSHLWFLQHLILMSIGAWALVSLTRGMRERMKPLPFWAVLHSGRFATLLLLAVSTVALWWDPQVSIGFRHTWWPPLANLLYYAPWFALGWFGRAEVHRNAHSQPSGDGKHRQTDVHVPFARFCELRVVASIAVFAVLLPKIREHVTLESSGSDLAVLATLSVLHTWLAATGWFGVCVHWLQRPTPNVVKYLSEVSLWVYLTHHPIVLLTHVSLSQVAIPLSLKFLLTSTVGIVLPLLMHSTFVRHTWVGVLLGGRRVRKSSSGGPKNVAFPVSEPQTLKKSA